MNPSANRQTEGLIETEIPEVLGTKAEELEQLNAKAFRIPVSGVLRSEGSDAGNAPKRAGCKCYAVILRRDNCMAG